MPTIAYSIIGLARKLNKYYCQILFPAYFFILIYVNSIFT